MWRRGRFQAGCRGRGDGTPDELDLEGKGKKGLRMKPRSFTCRYHSWKRERLWWGSHCREKEENPKSVPWTEHENTVRTLLA